FLATYSTDAEVVSSAGSVLRGHGAMSEHYGRRLETPDLRCEILDARQVGSRWVVAHELVGDDTSSTEVVATFEVADGAIRRASLMLGDTQPRSAVAH